jgi:hypothetical protein
MRDQRQEGRKRPEENVVSEAASEVFTSGYHFLSPVVVGCAWSLDQTLGLTMALLFTSRALGKLISLSVPQCQYL